MLVILEAVRDRFGPVIVSSGHRCEKYNAQQGGGANSQHLVGRAADIVCPGADADVVADFVDRLGVGGLGRYLTGSPPRVWG